MVLVFTGIFVAQMYLSIGKLIDGQLGTVISRRGEKRQKLPSVMIFLHRNDIFDSINNANKTLAEQYKEIKPSGLGPVKWAFLNDLSTTM